VTIERTYHCDGPDCEVHARTPVAPPYLPAGFIGVSEGGPSPIPARHFCSWDCLMKYAARFPAPERIEWNAEEG
jgi:hypothetical protein